MTIKFQRGSWLGFLCCAALSWVALTGCDDEPGAKTSDDAATRVDGGISGGAGDVGQRADQGADDAGSGSISDAGEPELDGAVGVDGAMDGAPPPLGDIVDVLTAAGGYDTLLAAIDTAALVEVLRGPEPLTLFAPTDAAFVAFEAAHPDRAAELFGDGEALARVLRAHVVPGVYDGAAVAASDVLFGLPAVPLVVAETEGGVTVAGAPIEAVDRPASNGIIHTLGAVVLPPEPAPQGTCDTPVRLDDAGFVFGSTVGAQNAAEASCADGARSPDVVFAFAVDAPGTVCFSTEGSTFDTALHVRAADCGAPELEVACNDDAEFAVASGQRSAVEFDPQPGVDYFVFVDGFGADSEGDFSLQWITGPCGPSGDLIETLQQAGEFETLLAALETAELTDTLRGDGALTVFAPTDFAFEALAAIEPDAAAELLADPDALTDLLHYHLAPGDLDAAALLEAERFDTLAGLPARLEERARVVVNGIVPVVDVDRVATNGRIHVLSGVLTPPVPCAMGCAAGDACFDGACLPPPLPDDIISALQADGGFTTLLSLLETAGLVDALRQPGPYTLFAPTDRAFAAYDAAAPGGLAALTDDPLQLAGVLLFHLVEGALDIDAVLAGGVLPSLTGEPLPVNAEAMPPTVAGQPLIDTEARIANGVVHTMAGMLVPPDRLPAGRCVAPNVIDGPGAYPTDTSGSPSEGTALGCGRVGAGADAVFSLIVDEQTPVCLSSRGTAFDTVLYVRIDDCGDRLREAGCNDDSVVAGLDGRQSALGFDAWPDRTYYIFADGVDVADEGPYALDVSFDVCRAEADLYAVLAADGRFEILVAAFEAADLADALRGADPLTVLAPTDAAFAALEDAEPGALDRLLADREGLVATLGYHLIAGELGVRDLTDREPIELVTVGGRSIRSELDSDAYPELNGITAVRRRGLRATNGIVHAIGAVLPIPPPCVDVDDCEEGQHCSFGGCMAPSSWIGLVELISGWPPFATMTGLLEETGLIDVLYQPDPLTIFIPTNDAFEALAETNPDLAAAIQADPAVATRVVQYHLVAGAKRKAAIERETALFAVSGLPIPTGVVDDLVTVGGVPLRALEVGSGNSVVHSIDEVLTPPEPSPIGTCAAPVELEGPGFSVGSTAGAADRARARCGLDAAGPDTVFALRPPRDGPVCLTTRGSAFDTVLHVRANACDDIDAEIACNDNDALAGGLQSAVEIEAQAGETYWVWVDGLGPDEGGAFVLEVREGPCRPGDLIEELIDDGRFGTTLERIETAGMTEMLRGGAFTVLAPVDAAWLAVEADDRAFFAERADDPVAMAEIMAYHLLPGDVSAREVRRGRIFETVEGRSVVAEQVGGVDHLNRGARLVDADHRASNGRYHVVDAPLRPPPSCEHDGPCERPGRCDVDAAICLPAW